jgi:hypothetical protein
VGQGGNTLGRGDKGGTGRLGKSEPGWDRVVKCVTRWDGAGKAVQGGGLGWEISGKGVKGSERVGKVGKGVEGWGMVGQDETEWDMVRQGVAGLGLGGTRLYRVG